MAQKCQNNVYVGLGIAYLLREVGAIQSRILAMDSSKVTSMLVLETDVLILLRIPRNYLQDYKPNLGLRTI